LTTSFGWQASEVLQQQDIHELCRVMFDALEKKLKSEKSARQTLKENDAQGDYVVVDHAQSTHHDLINRLYQGQRFDRVRCCVCQSVSNKPATFLDIQVPLRPFGLDVSSYSSLDEAFRAMLEPERLDGPNQYYCSHCGVKQDAMLDCVYERMPYLLSLQLMRFTFDPRTGNRIKLHDRVSFPLEDWDITEFIVPSCDSPNSANSSGPSCGARGDSELFDDDEAVVCSLNEDGQQYTGSGVNGVLSASSTTEPIEDEDIELGTDSGANSGIDSSAFLFAHDLQFRPMKCFHTTPHNDRPQFMEVPAHNKHAYPLKDPAVATTSAEGHILDRTPTKVTAMETKHTAQGSTISKPPSKWVYTLFSIVVHSGSISGGHYYAYIKSFTDNQWYQFNDRHVTKASYTDLLNTFGAKQTSYASRASAYYLMYRRIDPLANEDFLSEDQFPPHIAEIQIRAEEAEEEAKRIRAMSLCKISVFTRSPGTNEVITSLVSVYKDQTMDDAIISARAALLPLYADSKDVSCRLIQYSQNHDCFGQSVDYAVWHRTTSHENAISQRDSNDLLGYSDHEVPPPPPRSTEASTSTCALGSIHTEEPKAAPACGTVGPLLVDEFINKTRTLWLEHRLNVPGALESSSVVNQWRTYEPKGKFIFPMSRFSNELTVVLMR
uniref:USP domain-containing protein n=1 Tax=Echinostoma caproni TaxID=27848 RepID=A0A183AQB1_9TREM